jgi:hypothetical protein
LFINVIHIPITNHIFFFFFQSSKSETNKKNILKI